MNILFVHEVDWINKVVFDIHIIADVLSARGHRVFAIDYEDKWKRSSWFDFGSLKTRRFDGISRALPEASVDVIRPGFIKIPAISRITAAFTHYLEIRKTIKEKNIDVIIMYSAPTNGLQTVYLARKFNIPVIFRSIDILSILVPYSVLRPLTRLIEKRIYKRADRVLPNTPQYLKYILSMGADDSRVKLVPLPVDTGLFHPSVDSSEIRQKWGLEGKDPIIVFIGTLFEFSGLDEFLRNFPAVLKEVPDARLLIVGDGPQRPTLERIINELDLNRQVIITGFQPYQTMPQYINLATVCINTFLLNDTTNDIFPAKIMQYVACGKATVATALRGITTLLPGESTGVVYAPDNAGVAGEVINLLISPEQRRQIEKKGLNYIKRHFNYDTIAQDLESIMEEIISNKKHDR